MRLALLSCLATLCSTPAFGQLSTPAEWPPVPVTFVDLTYPSAARDAGVSGRVIVHATVDETGHVSSAEALVGPPELAPAAVDNLRQWMFPLTARDVYTVYRFEFTAGRCNDDARSLFRLESPNLAIVTACTRVDRKQPLPWAPFTEVPFDWIRPLVYPPIAQSARIQGVVIVDVRYDGAGRVHDARALAGFPLLRQAAADHATTLRFHPVGRRRSSLLIYEFTLPNPCLSTGVGIRTTDYFSITACAPTVDVSSVTD